MDKDDLQRQEEVQEINEREAVLKEYSLKADSIEKDQKTGRKTEASQTEGHKTKDSKTEHKKLEKNKIEKIKETYGNGLKWLLLGVLCGAVVGSISAFFAHGIVYASTFRVEHPQVLFALPFAGLLLVFAYSVFSAKNAKGTNLVIESVRKGEQLPADMAPLIMFSTVVSHFFGASVGREGAALQVGGSLGSSIGRILHLSKKEQRRIMMCGMSAAFSGLFGTPLAAAIFAIELCTVGSIYYTALLPCTVSALTAHFFAEKLMHAEEPDLALALVAEMNWSSALYTLLLAIAASLVSILFVSCAHKAKTLFSKYFPNPYLRIFVSGAIILCASLALNTNIYNGTGMHIIAQSIQEPEIKVFLFSFLLKILFTAVSLGGGFQGGEIVPSLFIGATLGNALSNVLPLDPSLCAALGMTSLFCGVTNCPLSALLISFELFGFEASSYFILAIAISYLFSGNYGLYHSQKILFSKTDEEEINEHAH